MAEHDDALVIAGIELVERFLGVTEKGEPGPIIKLLIIPLSIRRYRQLPDEGLFARCFNENENRGTWKLHGDPRGRALGWVNTHKGPGEAYSCDPYHYHVLWTPDEVHLYHDAFSYEQYVLHPFLRDLRQLFIGTEEDEEPQ